MRAKLQPCVSSEEELFSALSRKAAKARKSLSKAAGKLLIYFIASVDITIAYYFYMDAFLELHLRSQRDGAS